MSEESYWNIPEDIIVAPSDVLAEQASALTNATKGLLRGEIKAGKNIDGNIEIALFIVVPAMDQYKFKILDYEQDDILLYPGKMYDYQEEEYHVISSESELREAIKKVLSSQATGRVISSLLAQARSASRI